ncbi:hypothetical protein AX774_g4669 [Zancudomyces culisetae]|uniref:Uncharacterized protein n=1 Tax=Zancudomyces culisetae TaxID=1213189 RepID=A0A1R1PLL7_ZANCU|nr:hypothetical protein AX774_g4669 [Zancudomyces culisetae]|eukprot:OMH81871.1 hypothetical protein AX774_g4669 [Zancudomyces culisetae]
MYIDIPYAAKFRHSCKIFYRIAFTVLTDYQLKFLCGRQFVNVVKINIVTIDNHSHLTRTGVLAGSTPDKNAFDLHERSKWNMEQQFSVTIAGYKFCCIEPVLIRFYYAFATV